MKAQTMKPDLSPRGRQKGAAIVEFALVAVIFLTLLLGIMDFGRMLFTWNAAVEATRFGARVAVVCGKDDALVLAKMRNFLPQLSAANVVVTWFHPEGVANASCDKTNCKGVRVSLYSNPDNPDDARNFRMQAVSPFMGFVMPPVPAFPAYLPRESMEASNAAGEQNPICL